VDSSLLISDSSVVCKKDSVEVNDTVLTSESKILAVKEPVSKSVFHPDSLLKNVPAFEYLTVARESFYKVLYEFRAAKEQEQFIHILHFGDSQIEGDRFSSVIRRGLQSKFGGEGIGLFPPLPLNNNISLKIRNSGNWIRYTERELRKKQTPDFIMGAIQHYAQPLYKEDQKHAWIYIDRKRTAYKGAGNYSVARVFYGYNEDDFLLELCNKRNKILDKEVLAKGNELRSVRWSFKKPLDVVRFQFSGKGKPRVFGISLEAKAGVTVDNIPNRASRGLHFSVCNKPAFSDMLKMLNTRLIIYQFGVNMLPLKKVSYKSYEEKLIHELKYLKSLNPGVQVLVIGVNDVSIKESGTMRTNKHVVPVRNAQRKAALATGCVYWDCFSAMGGDKSMIQWVKNGYGQKDYTHLSTKGAKLLSEMFMKAFNAEYKKFEKVNDSKN